MNRQVLLLDVGVLGVLAALAVACASGEASVPPAKSESAPTMAGKAYEPSPAAETPPASPPALAQPPATPNASEREARRVAAHADIERAQADLEASTQDCEAACRALASMDRATGVLCGIAEGRDDRRRCDDAKRRVMTARDRVRLACGSCPGGPSVDRHAPIPSTP